jgi:pimeloyl-ACP methyl ester carboxylesterase
LWEQIKRRVGGNYGHRDSDMLIAQWQACIDFDIVDVLPSCPVPIHAIGFDQDLQTPAPLVRRIAALAANGHFHLLHGLGHVSCEIHKPDIVNAKIREIISLEAASAR